MPSAACTVVRAVSCPMILTLIGAEVGQMVVVLVVRWVATNDGGIRRPRTFCRVTPALLYERVALFPERSPPGPTGARTWARAGAAPSRRSVNVTSAIIRRMGAPPCGMSGHRPLVTPAVAEVVDDLFDPADPPPPPPPPRHSCGSSRMPLYCSALAPSPGTSAVRANGRGVATAFMLR